MYREVVFELTDGRAVTPLFQALTHERLATARLQATSLAADFVSVLIDYMGPAAAVEAVRRVVREQPEQTVLHYDALVDEDQRIRFVATWRRPDLPDHEGVSLEHHLFDTVGPGGLLFGRVEGGIISYKAASPEGRGLQDFIGRLRSAFGERFNVRTLRTGPFRAGWEIEEAPRAVRADDTALLIAAFHAGYYDEPRRCGVRELGDVLGVSKSVVARRLRVLERQALERLVDVTGQRAPEPAVGAGPPGVQHPTTSV